MDQHIDRYDPTACCPGQTTVIAPERTWSTKPLPGATLSVLGPKARNAWRAPRRVGALWLLALALPFVGGCVSINKIQKLAPQAMADTLEFKATPETVRWAAREALLHAKYQISEDKQLDDGTISVIGLLGAGLQSWGQWGRISIQKKSEDTTVAYILTIARVPGNVTEDVITTRKALKLYLNDLVASRAGQGPPAPAGVPPRQP